MRRHPETKEDIDVKLKDIAEFCRKTEEELKSLRVMLALIQDAMLVAQGKDWIEPIFSKHDVPLLVQAIDEAITKREKVLQGDSSEVEYDQVYRSLCNRRR